MKLPDDFRGGAVNDGIAVSKDGSRCAVVTKDKKLLIFDRPTSGDITLADCTLPLAPGSGIDAEVLLAQLSELEGLFYKPENMGSAYEIDTVLPIIRERLADYDAPVIKEILENTPALRQRLRKCSDDAAFKLNELVGPLPVAVQIAAEARAKGAANNLDEAKSLLSILEALETAKKNLDSAVGPNTTGPISSLLLNNTPESLDQAALILARSLGRKASLPALIEFIGLTDCLLTGQDLRADMHQAAASLVEAMNHQPNFAERAARLLLSMNEAPSIEKALADPGAAALVRADLIRAEFQTAQDYERFFAPDEDSLKKGIHEAASVLSRGGVLAQSMLSFLQSKEVLGKIAAECELAHELAKIQSKEIFSD